MWTIAIVVCVIAVAAAVFFLSSKSKGTDIDQVSRERSGRIDIYSQDMEFKLDDVKSGGTINSKCDYAHWLQAQDQNKYWIAEGQVTDKWENLWVEFTPKAAGYVFINLRGSYYDDLKEHRHDVWVDDCQLDGGLLKNGDFEMIDPQGKPAHWGWGGTKKRYSIDGSEAKNGRCCVLVWHDIPLVQRVEVKANVKYRVSAWFKGPGGVRSGA